MHSDKKIWVSKIFYDELIGLFPELKNTRVGNYDKFHRVISRESNLLSDNNICVFTIKVTPYKNVFPVDFQLIDKSFYASSTKSFLDRKFGEPSTKIDHVKRNLISLIIYPFKPLTRLMFGVYSNGQKIGLVCKGDIKIDISNDYGDRVKYVLILNHDLKTAKIVFKETKCRGPDSNYTYTSGDDFKEYLKEVGISNSKEL